MYLQLVLIASIIYEYLVRPIHPNQDMSSSIFKSICAAAAFGASPTAAQIGNWDILYQSLETDFQDSVTNEITLKYKIGTGRTFDVALFEKNCVGPITGMNITSTTDLTPLITTDLDQLEIMLDLDKSAITSSNIWDGGKSIRTSFH